MRVSSNSDINADYKQKDSPVNIGPTKAFLKHPRPLENKFKISSDFLHELIHIAGHDLRSPIFVIRSYAQLLQKTKDEDRLDRGFQLIAEATSNLECIINSLVQLVDTYTLKKPGEELLLFENTCQKVKLSLYNKLESSQAIIFTDFISCPVVRFYDPYLKDIMHIFVENAILHNPGLADLEINISTYQKNQKTILEVRDNGVGVMDTSELKKLSSPFYSSSKAENCVGIGLAKVQAIAQICQGEMELENAKEGGFIARYIF